MSKTSKKIYAVARGRKTGIFSKWFGEDGAEVQIRQFSGARYKGFSNLEDARKWLCNPVILPGNSRNKTPENTKLPQVSTSGKIIIHTDGGCFSNPGPGGYAAVITKDNHREELSGGFRRTTNNRMELKACIESLKKLGPECRAVIFSDSRYVVNGITKGWAKKWRMNNWKRNRTDMAENPDLWQELLDQCDDKHSVEFVWIKGHAGHEENERCDQLAGEAASGRDLPPDIVYEKQAAKS